MNLENMWKDETVAHFEADYSSSNCLEECRKSRKSLACTWFRLSFKLWLWSRTSWPWVTECTAEHVAIEECEHWNLRRAADKMVEPKNSLRMRVIDGVISGLQWLTCVE